MAINANYAHFTTAHACQVQFVVCSRSSDKVLLLQEGKMTSGVLMIYMAAVWSISILLRSQWLLTLSNVYAYPSGFDEGTKCQSCWLSIACTSGSSESVISYTHAHIQLMCFGIHQWHVYQHTLWWAYIREYKSSWWTSTCVYCSINIYPLPCLLLNTNDSVGD